MGFSLVQIMILSIIGENPPEILTRFCKGVIMVCTSPFFIGMGIILAIIFPRTKNTCLPCPSFVESIIATTGALHPWRLGVEYVMQPIVIHFLRINNIHVHSFVVNYRIHTGHALTGEPSQTISALVNSQITSLIFPTRCFSHT